MWAFATYFMWNRKYAANYAHTLETLQRCILNLHPAEGSRSPKGDRVGKRVDTFYKRIQKVSVIQNNNNAEEIMDEN